METPIKPNALASTHPCFNAEAARHPWPGPPAGCPRVQYPVRLLPQGL